jgi:hypothetical protein
LDGFEVGFESWVAVAALEAAGADYFFGGEGAEDGGDDFVGGGFVVLFELAVVFFEGFSVRGVKLIGRGLEGEKRTRTG